MHGLLPHIPRSRCAQGQNEAKFAKGSKINAQEFGCLCNKVAAMPRRFGIAPAWEAEYGGSIKKRTAARKAILEAVDS